MSALRRLVTATLVSPAARAGRRMVASAWRRARFAAPAVHYFHDLGDPYCHLTAQVIPGLLDGYDVRIIPHLVSPPADAAAPERARLAAHALADARLLADAHGLSFPNDPSPPGAAALSAAAARLVSISSPEEFARRAFDIGAVLWGGRSAGDEGPAPESAAGDVFARGDALRKKLGHYLGAMFYFEGEWYWGLDRLPYLEERLAHFRALGAEPVVRRLEAGAAPGSAPGAVIDFYASLRSPYTYLAASRVHALARVWGARVEIKFVLPMVMRGLPVPRSKQFYIMRDAKREAERLGMPFGRVADPVGPGAERGLAVLHRAIPAGAGEAFLEAFLAGVWAEGIDAASDAGLRTIAERAGLDAAFAEAALEDESWREKAAQNREELFAMGLWGVPSFRVDGGPPRWGQDRLWAVEKDLAALADRKETSAAKA